jgi:four helix bundle protein
MFEFQYSFEKLDVWMKARAFVKYIYQLTKKYPDDEKFILVSQLKRASISIVSNIAEGSSRSSMKDQMRFTEIAFGSTVEVYCQLIISSDLEFISTEELEKAKLLLREISNKLNALQKSQQKRILTNKQITTSPNKQ